MLLLSSFFHLSHVSTLTSCSHKKYRNPPKGALTWCFSSHRFTRVPILPIHAFVAPTACAIRGCLAAKSLLAWVAAYTEAPPMDTSAAIPTGLHAAAKTKGAIATVVPVAKTAVSTLNSSHTNSAHRHRRREEINQIKRTFQRCSSWQEMNKSITKVSKNNKNEINKRHV